jgi:hypothetical protein
MTWLSAAGFIEAVEAATRAPSMHNTQPWRFRQRGGTIEVLADPDRRLPVADATGWATRLGCGAALFNLRLALAARGAPAAVRLLPDHNEPHLLARLIPQPPRRATPSELRLYQAIPRRHSNRAPFLDKPVPIQVRAELIAAAATEHGWLDLLLGPAAVEAAGELLHRADAVLNRDANYQVELESWTRSDAPADGAPAVDGVPAAAGGPVPEPHRLLPRRDFGGPTLSGQLDYERERLLAVLGGDGDRPGDHIQAGQALQAVLLTATDLGLAASMFSQPIEVPAIRKELRSILGRHALPQMLLRFGYATPAPSSPRRPVTDVLID